MSVGLIVCSLFGAACVAVALECEEVAALFIVSTVATIALIGG